MDSVSLAGSSPLRTMWQPDAARRCAAVNPRPRSEPVMSAHLPDSGPVRMMYGTRTARSDAYDVPHIRARRDPGDVLHAVDRGAEPEVRRRARRIRVRVP